MPDVFDQIAAEQTPPPAARPAAGPGRGDAAPDVFDQIHADKLASQSNIQRFAQSWWDNSVLKHPIDSAVSLVKSLVTMPDYHQLSQQEKDAVDAQMEKAWNDAAANVKHPTPEYAGMLTSKATNAAIVAGATYGVGKGLGAAVDAAPHAWEATKAAVNTAAPDVAKGTARTAVGLAAADVVPGPAWLKTAVGIPTAGPGVTQIVKGLAKGFEAGKNAWADSVAARMTAKDAAARAAAEAAAPPTWQPGPPGTPEPPPPPEHWEPYTAPGAAPAPAQWEPYRAPTWEPGPAGTPAPRASAWEPYEPPLKAEHIDQYDAAAAAKPEAQPAGDVFDQIHAEATGEPDARATLPPELAARVEQLRAETHSPEELERARLADWIGTRQAHNDMTALDNEWTARAAKADHIAEFVLRHNLEQTPAMYAKVADELGYDKPPSEDAQAMIADRLDWFRARHPALAPAPAEVMPAPAQIAAPAASISQMDPRAVSAAAPADLEQQLRDSLAARGVNVPAAAPALDSKILQAQSWKRATPGQLVDGLEMHADIPNTGSIPASLGSNYKNIGVREIPMDALGPSSPEALDRIRNNPRVMKLADEIKNNGMIKPLIVVVDKSEQHPYILEGAHRIDALDVLGKKSVPALVVVDKDSFGLPEELDWNSNETAAGNQTRQGAQGAEAQPAAAETVRGTGTGAPGEAGRLLENGTRNGAPLPEASSGSESGQPAAAGDRKTVRVPGEAKQYGARYEVRELQDLQPSHNGQTFQKNPAYEHTNDRDYNNPDNQRKIVDASVGGDTGFDPRYVINTAPDASIGPPVADSRGNVLGGNGRTMTLQRVFESNPAGAAEYRALLDRSAHHFGIDPESYAHMKEPVLVRVLDAAETGDAAAVQRAVTDFNKVGTAALTPAERAIADAHGVSQKTLDDIGRRIEHAGSDATLNSMLDEGRNGVDILQNLINDGVISPQERATLASADELKPMGRARVSNLMLGRFFTNAQQLDNLPNAIRAKMERMAAPLARAEGSPEYSLSPTVREALDLIDAADMHGVANLRDFVNQKELYSDTRQFSPASLRIAEQLRTRDPVALTNATRQYAARAKEAADYQGPGVFGDIPEPLTRGDAFDESFGPAALERDRIAKEAEKAKKAAAKAAKKAAEVATE